MAYQNEGIDQRAEVLLGDAVDTLSYWPKADGAAQAVDVGTAYVTVLDPAGGVKVARTGATIGALGQLSLAQPWPGATYLLNEDYVALWEWQSAGVAYADRQFFDIVKLKLPCLIDTSDLLDFYPNLEDHLRSIKETDASKFARRAWSIMLDRIRSGGHRPSLILDRARLVNPAVQLALHLAAEAMVRQVGDLWSKRSDIHSKNYENLFGGLGTLRYDRDEDGLAAPNKAEEARVNRKRGWV